MQRQSLPPQISASCPEFSEPKDPFFATSIKDRKKLFEEKLQNQNNPQNKSAPEKKQFRLIHERKKSSSCSEIKMEPPNNNNLEENPLNTEISEKVNKDQIKARSSSASKLKKDDNPKDPFATVNLRKSKNQKATLRGLFNSEIEDAEEYLQELKTQKKENEKELKNVAGFLAVKSKQKENEKKQRILEKGIRRSKQKSSTLK